MENCLICKNSISKDYLNCCICFSNYCEDCFDTSSFYFDTETLLYNYQCYYCNYYTLRKIKNNPDRK